MFKDFTEMPVWQKAMEIAVECFFLSERLPRKEDYGLTSQLRRSAESISANIAEAFGRRSNKDKSRVYDISRSEAFETKNHLIYTIVRYAGLFFDDLTCLIVLCAIMKYMMLLRR